MLYIRAPQLQELCYSILYTQRKQSIEISSWN